MLTIIQFTLQPDVEVLSLTIVFSAISCNCLQDFSLQLEGFSMN